MNFKEGLAEGHVKGEMKAAQRNLLRMGASRFGQPADVGISYGNLRSQKEPGVAALRAATPGSPRPTQRAIWRWTTTYWKLATLKS